MRDTAGWDWTIEKSPGGGYTYDAVTASVLMDIRDELLALRRIVSCNNFLSVPSKLDRIMENTRRKEKPRKRRRKR